MAESSKKSEIFFRHYTGVQNRLYAYILTMVHNETDAEELLQETSALLWEHFDRFEPGTHFFAWARTIARNRVIDFVRKHRRHRWLFHEDLFDQVDQAAGRRGDLLSERLGQLRACVDKLRPADQQLIAMRFQNNMPVKQMAQATGRSANGLYKSLARVLRLLKDCVSRGLRQGGTVQS